MPVGGDWDAADSHYSFTSSSSHPRGGWTWDVTEHLQVYKLTGGGRGRRVTNTQRSRLLHNDKTCKTKKWCRDNLDSLKTSSSSPFDSHDFTSFSLLPSLHRWTSSVWRSMTRQGGREGGEGGEGKVMMSSDTLHTRRWSYYLFTANNSVRQNNLNTFPLDGSWWLRKLKKRESEQLKKIIVFHQFLPIRVNLN